MSRFSVSDGVWSVGGWSPKLSLALIVVFLELGEGLVVCPFFEGCVAGLVMVLRGGCLRC